MKTRRKKVKTRNWIAVNAWRRSGAGCHRDRKRDRKQKGYQDEQ
jgi:hypothetical protein